MKRISQKQLKENIELVKWDHQEPIRKFSLLTVHSLLIDTNPKFIELKQQVSDFNALTPIDVGRIHLKQEFIAKLYKMLCEMTRIQIYENQIDFLNKTYEWAKNDPANGNQDDIDTFKKRPTTSTTRTRPFSAYTRPSTAGRPTSGIALVSKSKKQSEESEVNARMNKDKQNINYAKLRHGEKEFYAGYRTLHEEEEHPKKRLKDYQRKVFYDEEEDSDIEIVELEVKEKEKPIKVEIEVPLEEEDLIENLADEQPQIGDEPNVDDIPIEPGEAAEDEPAEEEPEIVDKLKPSIPAYRTTANQIAFNQKLYQGGESTCHQQRHYINRQNNQDQSVSQMQALWANQKSRVNTELKRRAESARIDIHKRASHKQDIPHQLNTAEYIDLNVQPSQVNSKGFRPQTAFSSALQQNRNQIIKQAFIAGKLQYQELPKNEISLASRGMTAYGEKPKKKTFQEILRDAEQKVIKEAEEEVLGVKQVFAKCKIPIGLNKIAKSISYNCPELPEAEPFIGQITGMSMVKNPFIKVAKKKKKKKKK